MKECILCFAYAAALGVLSFFLGRLLPKRWLHPEKFPFRTYAWEDRLWKALQIRKWQSKVPDSGNLRRGAHARTSVHRGAVSS